MKCLFISLVFWCTWSSDDFSRWTAWKAKFNDDFSRWTAWKAKFNQNYISLKEEEHAFNCFRHNLREIEHLNSIDTAMYGENKFTYLCPDEFAKLYAGLLSPLPTTIVNDTRPDGNKTYAMSPIDWRAKGAVTPAKDQGHCGSCWAFSAVMTMEGVWKLAGNSLTGFSEQELVGCSMRGSDGCNGGIMSRAIDWVVSNGGIDSESDYPYISGGGQHGKECDSSKLKSIVGKFKSTVILNKPNEWISPEDLYAALVKYGPLSIGVYSGPMQHYTGGIMKICQTGQTDHGVGLVGYGLDTSSPPVGYWIVKNSWGKSWGEEGFMRVSTLYPNPCMINQSPVQTATA